MRKTSQLSVFIAFTLAAFGLIFFAVVIYKNRLDFQNNGIQKTAQVLEARTLSGRSKEYLVSFTDKNNAPEKEWLSSCSDCDVGATVEILVHPDSGNIMEKMTWAPATLPLILGGSGIGILLLLFLGARYQQREKIRIRTLKRRGMKIEADFVRIGRDEEQDGDKNQPIWIVLTWTDAKGKEWIFESERILEIGFKFTKAPVYIDHKDPSQYYVDLDLLVKRHT